MNTQEIKKQAREEFDSIFRGQITETRGRESEMYKFIDSLIDKTVLHEQERIVGICNDYIEGVNGCDDVKIVRDRILSLITNKSDSNK